MILTFLTALLATVTIAGFFRNLWWFTILDFFRLQYACLSLILLFIALYEVNIFISALNIAIIVANLFRIRKFLPQFSASGIHQNKKLFSVNAYKDNHKPEALKKIIQGADPEVLLIMEMTQDMEDALSEVLEAYEYTLESDVRDGFKISLYSKTPLKNKKVTYHGPQDTPLLQAKVQIDGKSYQVFSAHPKPALNAEWYEERHAYFKEIEAIIKGADEPVVVLGDFNSVPWEDHFSTFLNNTSLKSTVEGYGYKVTWPVFFPILGVPMDHILISRDETYSDLSVGPYVGSDHYPIGVNL